MKKIIPISVSLIGFIIFEQQLQTVCIWIHGTLVGGAWCCSRTNCWVLYLNKKETASKLNGILTNGIVGPCT